MPLFCRFSYLLQYPPQQRCHLLQERDLVQAIPCAPVRFLASAHDSTVYQRVGLRFFTRIATAISIVHSSEPILKKGRRLLGQSDFNSSTVPA